MVQNVNFLIIFQTSYYQRIMARIRSSLSICPEFIVTRDTVKKVYQALINCNLTMNRETNINYKVYFYLSQNYILNFFLFVDD